MKKYFYLLILVLAGFAGKGQNVPNGGFENWTNYFGFSAPDSWHTTDSASALQPSGSSHSAVQENTTLHTGSSAIKLQTWAYNNFFQEPGAASTGTLDLNSLQFVGGSPDTTRHDVLTGWFEYAPAGGDSCSVYVLLSRWNGSSRDTVGFGKWTNIATVSSYTQFTLQINYHLSGNPDTALIIVATAPLGINTAHAGTVMYVDDLNFAGIISTKDLPSRSYSVNTYPNPATDFLTIESKGIIPAKKSVSIIDIDGKLLQITPLIDTKQQIDISSLSNGNYFYELRDEKGVKFYSGKFSVNH